MIERMENGTGVQRIKEKKKRKKKEPEVDEREGERGRGRERMLNSDWRLRMGVSGIPTNTNPLSSNESGLRFHQYHRQPLQSSEERENPWRN